MAKAAFLDRDGVLIRTFVRDGTPHPPASMNEVEILPGVREAVQLLRELGHRLIVVTNQPDVARGSQRREIVAQINHWLIEQLRLDAVYVCYHDRGDNCACRKPAPGMLLAAARDHGIDLQQSVMVGDRGSDIEAGAAAGCRTFLIDHPYSQCNRIKPTSKAADLMDVARQISAQHVQPIGCIKLPSAGRAA